MLTTRRTDKPSKIAFSSLPAEIVIKVFKQLHWKDLLNARQTCRLLYNASKSREIWDDLIRIHAAATHRPPTIFEKPMHMYDAVKLEERFLRWMKTETTWLDEIPLHEKSIPDSPEPDSHEFLYSHLLRGGRWLICSDFAGEVLYCDLESPETGFIPLIPYPFSCQREFMTMMAVEEDPETEILSFNIALVHILFADWHKESYGQPEVTGDSRIDVWSGCVVLDQDGQVTSLHVEQLASVSVPMYFGRPLFGVSLRGPLVAFTVEWNLFGETIYGCDAVIIDWRSQKSKDRSFRRKTVNFRPNYMGDGRKAEVMLLPRGRLLTVVAASLCIYDLSVVPWSSEERPVCIDMSIPKRYSYHVPVPGTIIQHCCGFSQVFPLLDNEYRVVFNTLAGIRGLVLRYTDGDGFTATALELLGWREEMDNTITEFRSHFSYNCGVARSKSGCLLRARFTWPDEEASFENGISPMIGKAKETPLVMNMDVTTGRLSWIAAESGRVAMMDMYSSSSV